MPEGDTIHRTARTLQLALAGKTLVKSSIPGLAGCQISSVEARGKNLLIHFSTGAVLHTHMRMTGSWHVYRPGETWRVPARLARAVLEVTDFVAVCFQAPVVRLLQEKALPVDPILSRLGPDIVAPSELPGPEIRNRIRQEPDLEIGEAILRQQMLAGIGNIYKSEALFLEKVSPFTHVADLDDDTLDRIVRRASALLRRSVNREERSHPADDRLWVYRRIGKPCYRCGTPISLRRQGAAKRSTYYCSRCQPEPGKSSCDSDSAP